MNKYVDVLASYLFQVFLFKLHSEVQENIVIITAFPIVTLTCDVDVELLFSLFCASDKVESVSLSQSYPVVVSKTISKDCHPLLVWEIDSDIPSSESIALNYYISVSSVSSQIWSDPVCFDGLLQENNRHTVSVPVESADKTITTVPLVITSHRRNGMLFLIINIDPCPLLLLHNRTNMNIFYGQSFVNTDGKFDDKSVYEELQKHGSVPVLKPGSSAHYSFPSIQRLFPKVPDKFSMLCFGLMDETSQKYVWSIPFKVSIEKQFVHILGVCDFMVCSERVGHTVNLFIDPVNRIEVNANEVRSRIALATNAGISSDKKESVKSKENSSKKGSEIKQKSKIQSTSSRKARKHSNITVVPSNIYFVNVRVIHVSLILCDEFQEANKSIEVLRLNIDNVVLNSRPQNDSLGRLQDISLCFEHIQLDNQLNKEGKVVYDFPVVLLRHVDDKNQPESSDHQNMFLPNKIRENSMFILNTVIEFCGERKNVVVQSVKVDFLPMSIQIEDTFYYRVKSLLKTYVPENFHQHESPWCDIYVPKDVRGISLVLVHPVHLEHFKFNVTEVSVSLHADIKMYLSIERSLLNFQPFEREELFTSHYEIGEMITGHYMTGAMFKAGWIAGSIDLFGNPAGFARAVRDGVSDFIYLPYQGLLHGPRSFISGLTNGAISLVTSISSGAINSMANFTSSVSKNMDFLCLDEEHLARQELVRRQLPEGVTEGLAQGLSAFGLSVLGAVAGIVDHPLQVLISPTTPLKTATDFVGGIGKGLVGAFAKPIGGACELLSQTGYGLLYGSGWLNPAKRRYQPVTMSFDMLSSSIVKYVCKVALCQSFGDVLLSIEATYVNENGEYDKNILLLTSEALCILTEDEVSLERTFALTEIRCNKSDSDQSTLVIVPTSAFRKQLYSESGDVLDRVAEYVKKNREEISSAAESSSAGLENISESCRSSPTSHVFFLYPKDRTLFLTLFNYAKSKALHKGF
ncbi:Vacuolar protein sorting-associated protein 13B [Araneus ventricosus]|uniref:Vacuolar protein sorting-associated protein 13B n=1 Tax=Araneus ventricosus TaxID=182803 RepID=A0A4Y2ALP7_ARAVE|nr:Vacuolar protein sorting-associated protein 13B [Araneus ventricosus]